MPMITALGEPYGDPHVAIRQIIGKASGYPARLMLRSRVGWLGPRLIIVTNTKTAFGRASYNGQAEKGVGACGKEPGAALGVRVPIKGTQTETPVGQTNTKYLPGKTPL